LELIKSKKSIATSGAGVKVGESSVISRGDSVNGGVDDGFGGVGRSSSSQKERGDKEKHSGVNGKRRAEKVDLRKKKI
jgi:hypothetical protein